MSIGAELYFSILVCWLILVYALVHLWTLVLFGGYTNDFKSVLESDSCWS